MAQEVIKDWNPAIYARLSDEDNRAGLSLSIENQIDILRKFVRAQGWSEPKVFFDDNRTGTDFNRKGFQDMYAEAQNGKVNVLIIKDTSRFGRNWVKSGEYFEKIEEMGVRFISIQEGIDTIDPKCPALKMLPFYFVFNEWHSQTTSEKIKTVMNNSAKDGKCLSARAPHGYRKDPNDRHHLIVDPVSSGAIKRMYELRLQKLSYVVIARTLNAESYPSPTTYKKSIGDTVSVANRHGQWNADCLKDIFENPVYRGDTVYGRKTVVSYKNHRQVRQPMSEWIIVQGTHEPLVSREDWQTCYDMIQTLGRVRSTDKKDVAPFTGMLICDKCGSVLHRQKTSYNLKSGEKKYSNGYNCRTFYSVGKTACSSHCIGEKDLNALVCDDIRKKAGDVLKDEQAARNSFYAVKSSTEAAKNNADKAVLKQTNKRLDELKRLIEAVFEKSVLVGGASADMFAELAKKYADEQRELKAKAEQLTAAIAKQSKAESEVDTFIKLMKEHVNVTELVLVYKLDRLSRSQRDTLYLIEDVFLPNGVDFVSMQESFGTATPFGRAMIGMLSVFAQLEREQVKQRTRMGKIARAKEGLYQGGIYFPIGYDYVDGKLTVNEYEAVQIRRIFDLYIGGMSPIKIADNLREQGFTNRYGSWSEFANGTGVA